KAAVGYVPYAGQSFLPAFCNGNGGAENVARPFLAMSGTADTTAPMSMMEMAMGHFHGSRFLVELIDGQHELRPEDAGDLFTWTVTFLDAYLHVDDDPGAMARFIRMNGVNGGRTDDMLIDVHVPFDLLPGEVAVKEFQNSSVNRYVLAWTADDVARWSSTSGWSATGQSFTALSAPPANLASRMANVCRFSLPLADGSTSLFVTASWTECAGLRTQSGWRFDGYGFTIVPARADGACPAGYLGVNRLYNNGYTTNTSNHRYTTSDSTARSMVSQGWHYDGVTMCSLP
ncbi:MAG: hypothetical protein ACM3X5_05325, partial [Bacillota bacterium]